MIRNAKISCKTASYTIGDLGVVLYRGVPQVISEEQYKSSKHLQYALKENHVVLEWIQAAVTVRPPVHHDDESNFPYHLRKPAPLGRPAPNNLPLEAEKMMQDLEEIKKKLSIPSGIQAEDLEQHKKEFRASHEEIKDELRYSVQALKDTLQELILSLTNNAPEVNRSVRPEFSVEKEDSEVEAVFIPKDLTPKTSSLEISAEVDHSSEGNMGNKAQALAKAKSKNKK